MVSHCFHPQVCLKQENGYRCGCKEGWVKGKAVTSFFTSCRGKFKRTYVKGGARFEITVIPSILSQITVAQSTYLMKLWIFLRHVGHIHQYPKVAPLLKKKSRGGESWDLFSNQQIGLEVQKNLGLLMLSEVEGGS